MKTKSFRFIYSTMTSSLFLTILSWDDWKYDVSKSRSIVMICTGHRSTFGIVSRDVSTTRVYSCHFFLWDYWSDHKLTSFFHYFLMNPVFSLNLRQLFLLSQEVCQVSVVTIVLVSSCCKSEFHTSLAVSSVLTAQLRLLFSSWGPIVADFLDDCILWSLLRKYWADW